MITTDETKNVKIYLSEKGLMAVRDAIQISVGSIAIIESQGETTIKTLRLISK